MTWRLALSPDLQEKIDPPGAKPGRFDPAGFQTFANKISALAVFHSRLKNQGSEHPLRSFARGHCRQARLRALENLRSKGPAPKILHVRCKLSEVRYSPTSGGSPGLAIVTISAPVAQPVLPATLRPLLNLNRDAHQLSETICVHPRHHHGAMDLHRLGADIEAGRDVLV